MHKFNIIIPSVQLSKELIFCLKKLREQKYKNFCVSIVLDFKNKIKLPKLNFKINKFFVGNKSMSYKRNLASKIVKSEYIAFLDSDAYPPKKWLSNALYLLKINKYDVVGGPNIPFPKRKNNERITHYAKRSFFVTGHLNFRKYLAKDRLCEWLESCNFFLKKKTYLKYHGMDEKKILGEDKDFFERANKLNRNFKTFYSNKLFVYHKERNVKNFLIQRFIFGIDLLNILKFKNNLTSIQPLLPVSIFSIFIYLFFLAINGKIKFYLLLFSFFIIQVIIILNIKKYIKKYKMLILTLILINLANIAYSLGSYLAVFRINKMLIRKIYLKSRDNS